MNCNCTSIFGNIINAWKHISRLHTLQKMLCKLNTIYSVNNAARITHYFVLHLYTICVVDTQNIVRINTYQMHP